jgi:hypothetical protein
VSEILTAARREIFYWDPGDALDNLSSSRSRAYAAFSAGAPFTFLGARPHG